MTQGNTPGTPHPAAMPFREALCALPCGFALYDPDLRYVYVNEIMAAFNGVAVSDHAGRVIEDILPAPLVADVRAQLERVLETRCAATDVEIRGITARSSEWCTWGCDYFPVWAPDCDREGPPSHVAALVRDVTVQSVLGDRLDLLRSVLQQRSDALYVTRPDQDFRFVFVNEATERHYGRTAAELLTMNPCDLNPQWTLADLRASWQHMTTIGPLAFETVHRKVDGRLVPVFIQSRAVWHGGVGYVAGEIRSLEKERAAEQAQRALQEQLEHAQRLEAVGLLASGVAHDFNNLLAVVLANADLLTADEHGSDVADAATAIREAARQAADLTRQLLTFSRRDSGARGAVALNGVIQQAVQLLRGGMSERITVETELQDALPPARGRKAELAQIVMNLMVNARDAMPEGGRLRVSTRLGTLADERACLELRVADTGIGMDEKTRLRIFEPFFTTKETGRGTGLGLSVVYGIVQQLGGTIDVDSIRGQGTTFTVRLPVSEDDESAHPLATSGPPGGHGELIMVVDDEPALRHAVARMLTRLGYRSITAEDGEDAIARLVLGGDQVAVVLTDLRMPKMPGDELSEHVHRMRPDLPVLFMSGQADDATVRDTRLANHTVLAKPFSLDELAEALHQALMT
ncbi:MAG: PAS domain-containing protein [Gemmatimonadaceae bacterium]|nr:PAS domain-containing protein [Gemmatimonadaceae bacterium]